jgi:hypothetical protein
VVNGTLRTFVGKYPDLIERGLPTGGKVAKTGGAFSCKAHRDIANSLSFHISKQIHLFFDTDGRAREYVGRRIGVATEHSHAAPLGIRLVYRVSRVTVFRCTVRDRISWQNSRRFRRFRSLV